jgi:hypothetical protein
MLRLSFEKIVIPTFVIQGKFLTGIQIKAPIFSSSVIPWVAVKTQSEKIMVLTVDIPRKVLIRLQKLSVNFLDLIFA